MCAQESSALDALGQGVKIAEKHREKRRHEGFLAELCHGIVEWQKIFPWPDRSGEDRKKEELAIADLLEFLRKTNSENIDQNREIPFPQIQEMSQRGFFALKVPESLGGKGLSQTSYIHFMEILASYSSAIMILVSADNTIGAKFAILKYGTSEQKAKYLPSLAKWTSGFSFTEELVGSDPASMQTHALRIRNESGKLLGYRICGEKWYTTNAVLDDGRPLADYLAVVARIVDRPEEVQNSECYGIFIVPTNARGVSVGTRNEFSGMRGISNSNPVFTDVFVDASQRIGEEGKGFRIALEALNTGRIAIAANCVALAKQALDCSRWYAGKRQQWGRSIGEHESISKMLEFAASQILAMEAMTEYAALLTDKGKDARLAAAACKVFTSERAWTIVDNMMQIFGGRGYETYASLSCREKTAPVERMWRDARPNRIFEGSTQILSQWFMREGWDRMIDRGRIFLEKGRTFKKFLTAIGFVPDYLGLFEPIPVPALNLPARLEEHMRFVESCARKSARWGLIFSGKYRDKLPKKQLTLDRFFWILVESYAMAVSCSYAKSLEAAHGKEPTELADMFCRDARLRIAELFRSLRKNNDDMSYVIGQKILAGGYGFLRKGIVRLVE
ncbi:MAG: acyl-CoA dehydrogenase family protein [bacterium]|nr:acyl-CoA dehydrogenase family protein [bacterium]